MSNLLDILLIVCAAAAGGVLAGVACFLIGGMGGVRALNRRLTALQDDVDKIDERITSEVKARAGRRTQEVKSERENLAEAAALLAQHREPPNSSMIGR